jgi:hypothetical protein
MSSNLFIHVNDRPDLDKFGRRLFALLKVKIDETRYSENSPGGRYLVGEACGLRITLEEADYEEFATYDFLLSFRPQSEWAAVSHNVLDGFADIVARYLAKQELMIARPLEFGKKGTESVVYGSTKT